MALDRATTKPTGNSLRVPFGVSQMDGRLYEPRAVPLGAACGCICPGCHQPLYAKHCLGERVAPHFAHGPGTNCNAGYESAPHMAAKQLIDEERHLRFPCLLVQIHIRDAMGRLHELCNELPPAGYLPLKEVVLEKAIGRIRPDLLVTSAEIGVVLIEIAVTHFVDEEKLEKIAGMKIPLLEFDLSHLRTATFDDLRTALFGEPPSGKWLFHPKLEAAKAQFFLDLQPTLDKATADRAILAARQGQLELEEQLEAQEKERKRTQQEAQERSARFQLRSDADKLKILLRAFGVAKLPTALLARVRDANSFGVTNPLIWQAALFGGLIHLKPAAGFAFVRPDIAGAWLRERFQITPESSDSEQNAIWDYFVELSNRGALTELHDAFQIRVASLGAYETLRLLRLNQVSAEVGLIWAEEANWPSRVTAIIVAKAHTRMDSLLGQWSVLQLLSPVARTRLPREICDYYGSAGLDRAHVLEYLVCAGFLVVSGVAAPHTGVGAGQ